MADWYACGSVHHPILLMADWYTTDGWLICLWLCTSPYTFYHDACGSQYMQHNACGSRYLVISNKPLSFGLIMLKKHIQVKHSTPTFLLSLCDNYIDILKLGFSYRTGVISLYWTISFICVKAEPFCIDFHLHSIEASSHTHTGMCNYSLSLR